MEKQKKLRVGILYGGRSGEHEVSLTSAASVIRALDPEKYEAVPIGIAKDGRWLTGTPAQTMLPEILKSGQSVMLSADPNVAALVPLDKSSDTATRVDVVFPVMHGTYGEDGTVQGSARTRADFPTSALEFWAPPSEWIRMCKKDYSAKQNCQRLNSSRFSGQSGNARQTQF